MYRLRPASCSRWLSRSSGLRTMILILTYSTSRARTARSFGARSSATARTPLGALTLSRKSGTGLVASGKCGEETGTPLVTRIDLPNKRLLRLAGRVGNVSLRVHSQLQPSRRLMASPVLWTGSTQHLYIPHGPNGRTRPLACRLPLIRSPSLMVGLNSGPDGLRSSDV